MTIVGFHVIVRNDIAHKLNVIIVSKMKSYPRIE